MGILKEIKQNNRKRTWKIIIVILLVILIVGGYYYYNSSKTGKIVYKTVKVEKRDISSTLSADGKIAYKEQYDINFPTSGILSQIFKKEGDTVKSGEIIATLDDTYLKINLDKAKIAIDTANANLQAKLASKGQVSDVNLSQKQLDSSNISLNTSISQGELDVKNAQINVLSAKNDLDNIIAGTEKDLDNAKNNIVLSQKNLDNATGGIDIIRNQENINIENTKQKGITEINIIKPNLEKYLRDIDVLLGVSETNKNINNSFEIFLGAKDSNSKLTAENQFRTADLQYNKFNDSWKIYEQNGNYDDIKLQLTEITRISNLIKDNLKSTKEVLKNSITSSSFSQATIDTNILLFDSDINNLESGIQRLILAVQSIDVAQSSLDTKLLNQQNSIETLKIQLDTSKVNLEKIQSNSRTSIDTYTQKYNQMLSLLEISKTKLENNIKVAKSQVGISKASLDLKKSSIDSRELEPFYTAINSAKKGLEEAQARLDDAILKSPIDGKIGKLTVTKIGTIINTNPSNAFVTIINKNSLYVEAKIEEGDVPNIFVGQEVKLTFNSLENTELIGKVSYISDKAEIDSNSIVTYKTEITFDTKDTKIKEGFTTQIFFILKKQLMTLSLPFESIKDENGSSYVTLKNGTKKTIKVGINDGDYIEILEGLKEGDEIKY